VANYYGNLAAFWPEKEAFFVLHNNQGELVSKYIYPRWLPAAWRLWHEVRKKKINHVIVGHLLPLGSVTLLLCRLLKISYSVMLHGMDVTYASKSFKKKELSRRILQNAKTIICASNFTAEITNEIFGKELSQKISVINPGIDAGLVASQERKEKIMKEYDLSGKIVVLTIARLVKRKGVDQMLVALPEIIRQVPNVIYVIVGEGPDVKYLKNIQRSLGDDYAENIVFLGKIHDYDKYAWLALCNIFAVPSRQADGDFEGFGIVFLEAALFGKVVIGGNSGGVPDAIQDNASGFLVNPEDPEDIADKIVTLAKDKKLRDKMGEYARERAIKEFNWEKQANLFYDTIKRNI